MAHDTVSFVGVLNIPSHKASKRESWIIIAAIISLIPIIIYRVITTEFSPLPQLGAIFAPIIIYILAAYFIQTLRQKQAYIHVTLENDSLILKYKEVNEEEHTKKYKKLVIPYQEIKSINYKTKTTGLGITFTPNPEADLGGFLYMTLSESAENKITSTLKSKCSKEIITYI